MPIIRARFRGLDGLTRPPGLFDIHRDPFPTTGGSLTDNGGAGFGQLLRHYREAAGLTQEELGEAAGLSVRGISALETGERSRPHGRTVELLASALGISGADLASFREAARSLGRVDTAGGPTSLDENRRTRGKAPWQLGYSPARRAKAFRQLAIAGLSLLAIGAVAALLTVALAGQTASTSLPANTLGIFDLAGRTLRVVSLPASPSKLAGGFGSEWVTSTTGNQVFRVDWRSRSVTPVSGLWSQPEGVAVGAGAVWVVDSGDGQLERISPQSNTVVASIAVGTGPEGVTVFGGNVYVTNLLAATVSKIDPATNRVTATFAAGPEPAGIAGGARSLWVADEGAGNVLRLDPKTGQQVSVPITVGGGPTAVAFADSSAWVTNSLDGTISRIDAGSQSVITTQVGSGPNGVAAGGNSIWVGDEYSGRLTRLTLSGSVRGHSIRIRSAPSAVDLSGGRLWVAADGIGAEAHRGGVLTVGATSLLPEGCQSCGNPASIDPASPYSFSFWRLLIMTNDGLVGYRRTGGVDGATFVPDLATSIPAPTQGGRTYTFNLRRGIRYSDGKPVLASDFRYALERAFHVVGGLAPYFEVLVGGSHCFAHPQTCSLAKGIVTHDRIRQVIFHLVRPDPDFLYQLALPVADPLPTGTPIQLPPDGTVPATGPYEIVSYHPARPTRPGHAVRLGRLILGRNPFFHEWSAAAQPQGFPAEIVFTTGLSEPAELKSVETGKSDVMWDQPTSGQYARIRANYPTQTHENALDQTVFFSLNTRVAPFTSLAVRQAVNFALDRSRLAGPTPSYPLGGKVTCQVLPPDFLSYKPYCPYTLNPSPSGAWTAPDVLKAQRLVAHSGIRGMRVTVAVLAPRVAFARVLVQTLTELGFRARIQKFTSFNGYYGHVDDSRSHTQAAMIAWAGDYPAPSNFLDLLLSCKSFVPRSPALNMNAAGFCDRGIDAQIRQAENAQEANQGSATTEWAQVDHAMVDQAPLLPFENPLEADFVSRRVGDYQYNPEWGELIDQMWVR
jgi:YVTN family beta-propeller protein